ncbi:Flp pilus assembly protein CpaB [Pararhizobium mangrovi]|uniref:Flp pilus assembly protein CpaB n=1 Tax=Pararhizobium mangrovi TaxID=2590452 RepID=A0A506UF49_9HYPH|nr:Flp pilus assembly protein CpaB [Pararhizobium mangrovi]TPW32670.1 Flp pilus assembly protein CpaB [Pararhizobium mangrovi]
MKPARLVILAVAVVAAGLAGYIAMNMTGGGTETIRVPVVQQAQNKKVLVAKASLPVGARLKADDLAWHDWPEDGVVDGFYTKKERPDAIEKLKGSVVRIPMFAGEPVIREKIAGAGGNAMASLLPQGKRAVATRISVADGAGGFILPNDRVDVIMVRRQNEGSYATETVLSNIRVLAIDQNMKGDPDGKNAVVGATATLQLSPKQAKILAVAQQVSDRLVLALRSTADAGETDSGGADDLVNDQGQSGIQIIKSGALSSITAPNGGSTGPSDTMMADKVMGQGK